MTVDKYSRLGLGYGHKRTVVVIRFVHIRISDRIEVEARHPGNGRKTVVRIVVILEGNGQYALPGYLAVFLLLIYAIFKINFGFLKVSGNSKLQSAVYGLDLAPACKQRDIALSVESDDIFAVGERVAREVYVRQAQLKGSFAQSPLHHIDRSVQIFYSDRLALSGKRIAEIQIILGLNIVRAHILRNHLAEVARYITLIECEHIIAHALLSADIRNIVYGILRAAHSVYNGAALCEII